MKTILYHANCYDGFGAAFAAWKSFGDEAKYIPVSYGNPPPDVSDSDEIYILDFSFPKSEMLAMCEHAMVTVLDHHKTAQANFDGLSHPNLTAEFDMNRSGAMMAWQYFNRYHGPSPADSEPVPAPRLIEHIQDRDLWTYKIPGSREVHASLVSHPFDFNLWDSFNVDTLITEGRALIRMYASLVDNIWRL